MPLLPRPGSVTAITTVTPATPALVMKALLPRRTKWSPSRIARDFMAAASEPEPGSVRPHAASTSPRARAGRYACFCSAEPNRAM